MEYIQEAKAIEQGGVFIISFRLKSPTLIKPHSSSFLKY